MFPIPLLFLLNLYKQVNFTPGLLDKVQYLSKDKVLSKGKVQRRYIWYSQLSWLNKFYYLELMRHSILHIVLFSLIKFQNIWKTLDHHAISLFRFKL